MKLNMNYPQMVFDYARRINEGKAPSIIQALKLDHCTHAEVLEFELEQITKLLVIMCANILLFDGDYKLFMSCVKRFVDDACADIGNSVWEGE